MPTYILGISGYYHDSAAALLKDGVIVAAAQEERFTRKKHDAAFPDRAIRYCLSEAGITLQDLHSVVFYEKPLVKFERLLETYLRYAPKGISSFLKAMPVWVKEKLYLKSILKKELAALGGCSTNQVPKLLFTSHHQSHAASAFFPSPFPEALVLCLDGVGEWATSSIWLGKKNRLLPQREIRFPHSLGLLYSAFTYYTGFKVNSAEYKVMGLAPYGEPRFVDTIFKHLIDLKPDGSFRMNMDYFGYASGLRMTNEKFDSLFGGPPRQPEDPVTQREMDLARSVQVVTEEIVLRLVKNAQREFQQDYLCLAGGVALNCVCNGRIAREKIFKDIWVQPAAGDAGGALGAAFAIWHEYLDQERQIDGQDRMEGSYLGPSYSTESIEQSLQRIGANYERLPADSLLQQVSDLIAAGNVVGWFQGRMEFGPRALGNRSIIGDPRNTEMQSVMNLKIKQRESFRPFAPAVLSEHVSEYFDFSGLSPYMLMVAEVQKNQRRPITQSEEKLFGIEKLKVPRSGIPAVTHVDYSARLQTVHAKTNPRFYNLIKIFAEKTSCPILINTSFNVRGEPIVCTPEDAFRCFMGTEMDVLVIEDILLHKRRQPDWDKTEKWKRQFEMD